MGTQTYDLIFITTFIVKDVVEDLVSSVIQSNHNINLLLLIVCQNGSSINELNSEKVSVKTLLVSDKIGLSSARNLAIEYILDNDIKGLHVMFPDDDSKFDSSFFEAYRSCVREDVNYIIDVYCTNTNILFKKQKYSSAKVFSRFDWQVACSVNMLIVFDVFLKVGFFDEELGVGTHYGAGEDNDYFIRSCYYSDGFVYNNKLYNFHPAPRQTYKQYTMKQLISRFNSYGRGVIYCLCKHNMYCDAFIVCLRALGGGMKNLLLLKLKYSIGYFYSFFSRSSLLFSSLIAKFR